MPRVHEVRSDDGDGIVPLDAGGYSVEQFTEEGLYWWFGSGRYSGLGSPDEGYATPGEAVEAAETFLNADCIRLKLQALLAQKDQQ